MDTDDDMTTEHKLHPISELARFIWLVEETCDNALESGRLKDPDKKALENARKKLKKVFVPFAMGFITEQENPERTAEGHEQLRELLEAVFDVGVFATLTESAKAFHKSESQRMKGQKRGEALTEKKHGWQEAVKERVDARLAVNPNLSGTQLSQKIEEERQQNQDESQKKEGGVSAEKIERKKRWKTELPATLPEFDTVRVYIRTLLRERKKATASGTEQN
ncbi:MAG: hypothetical protein ACR652_26765 [Methylocystis sp.]|uniref:hypothetical protein n=1 Tax=Methylocystis sp. TaxID=1911079 RepID=UPI003DA51045